MSDMTNDPNMYFEKKGSTEDQDLICVLELRNYLLRPGMRDDFANYFAEHLVRPQQEIGGFVLGRYKVKGAPDHFLWMRGFHSMESRSRFLPEFYNGATWKQHRQTANQMMLNSDNVHLLRPLIWDGKNFEQGKGIRRQLLKVSDGIAILDFYISNTKLDSLISFFAQHYIPMSEKAGIDKSTFWVSELGENDFPALPAFQDRNLLVTITFYKNEAEYQAKQAFLESHLTPELKDEMTDLVTVKNTLVIYPDK